MVNQETRAQARNSPGTGRTTHASTDAVHRQTVIVPRRPGPLRDFRPRSRRPRDELDGLIDELFGPATDEKPSRFDAGLAIVGVGLAAWAIILGGPSVALWIGIASIVLGLALPARAMLRRFDSLQSGGFRRRVLGRGLPLDAEEPVVLALIDAYARLMQTSCMQAVANPEQAVSAGHAVVVEVARRLDGWPPDTSGEVRFVSMQIDALEAITREMLRSRDYWLAQAAMSVEAEAARMPPRTQPPPPNRTSRTPSSGRRP